MTTIKEAVSRFKKLRDLELDKLLREVQDDITSRWTTHMNLPKESPLQILLAIVGTFEVYEIASPPLNNKSFNPVDVLKLYLYSQKKIQTALAQFGHIEPITGELKAKYQSKLNEVCEIFEVEQYTKAPTHPIKNNTNQMEVIQQLIDSLSSDQKGLLVKALQKKPSFAFSGNLGDQ